MDPTKSLEGLSVVVWRVDVVFVEKDDWKYEGSTAGASGGGRTHTFGLRNPYTKLADKNAYQKRDVRIAGGKAVISNGGH